MSVASISRPSREFRLAPALASLVALRSVMDAGIRAPLPYLTFIAAAFGARAADAGWLAMALSLAGLVSPLVGALEAALGRRQVVITLTLVFAVSCLLMAFAQSLGMALALCVVIGVSRALMMPQIHALLGDRVPWEKRGLAVGVVELAWAMGWIVGVLLFGWLIERLSWWMPFGLLGVASVVGLGAALRFALAGEERRTSQAATGWLSAAQWRTIARHPQALRLLAHGALISFASQLVTLTYAPHLAQTFALTPLWLGVASIVIGLAEIVAEIGTALLSDRFGKWVTMLVCTIGFAAALVAQSAWADALPATLAGLFAIFFFFEFALVASLAVNTEVVPQARAAMVGLLGGLHSVGRIAGSLVALPLLFAAQWTGVLWMSAGAVAIGVLILLPTRPVRGR